MKTLFTRIIRRMTTGNADAEFIADMKAALQDGVLLDEERYWLLDRHSQLKAGDGWREIGPELFAGAVRGALHNGELSDEAEAQLESIREYLGLEISAASEGWQLIQEARQIKADREKVALRNKQSALEENARIEAKNKWLDSMRRGEACTTLPTNVVFQRQEHPIYCAAGELLEVLTVGRNYVAGSRGVSIRIAKGVSVRTGNSRGYSVPVQDLVPTSDGNFIVTNKRLIFSGSLKSHSDTLEKIIDMSPGTDGLRYGVTRSSKPRIVRFLVPDREALMAALQGAFQPTV